MKHFICGFACLALVAVGCGDDSSDEPDTGGNTNQGGEPNGAGGEPTSSGGEPTSSGGGGSVNVTCDPAEEGVCQNPTDCPSVQDGSARSTAQACGVQCVGEAESCAIDCITSETSMTDECAGCYAGAVTCATENCLSVCLAGPASDACAQCQVDEGCREEFDTCSGLPSQQ